MERLPNPNFKEAVHWILSSGIVQMYVHIEDLKIRAKTSSISCLKHSIPLETGHQTVSVNSTNEHKISSIDLVQIYTFKESIMMWDEGGFMVCGGDFVELRKNKRKKWKIWSRIAIWILASRPMIQSMELTSIPKKIASFFYHNHSIIFKDHYMAIYSLQHVHYTCNYW